MFVLRHHVAEVEEAESAERNRDLPSPPSQWSLFLRPTEWAYETAARTVGGSIDENGVSGVAARTSQQLSC